MNRVKLEFKFALLSLQSLFRCSCNVWRFSCGQARQGEAGRAEAVREQIRLKAGKDLLTYQSLTGLSGHTKRHDSQSSNSRTNSWLTGGSVCSASYLCFRRDRYLPVCVSDCLCACFHLQTLNGEIPQAQRASKNESRMANSESPLWGLSWVEF